MKSEYDNIDEPGLAKISAAGFPIAGIGASAGGLEAFTQLLQHLPVETGMAFVLIQHLDPTHESALPDILSRVTSLPVHEVSNNLSVEPGHIYVIPPNTSLEIDGRTLRLGPRPLQTTSHHVIDSFFESLAHEQHERAIGVVLSGTASDGTVGLEAIKAEGGITIAQDDSAKYGSMPRSAIATGCVDLVLSPEGIALELARIARHPYIAPQEIVKSVTAPPRSSPGRKEHPASGENSYKKILQLLRNHSGVDFTCYKSNTIQRRLGWRVVLNGKSSLDEYLAFLRANTPELNALYSDMLINVTDFFRNPEAFETLKRKVFPSLFQPQPDDPVRVWVPGCSTGQEAYSIALLLMEFGESLSNHPELQIFATDLNETALEKARAGMYSKSLLHDVSPDRLEKYFTPEDGSYRVKKTLREKIIFARHNLMTDPPFSRMNLISCRNLLIYLDSSVQKRIIPSFHYALKTDGFLFLGLSESVESFNDLFGIVERKHKIFSKIKGPMVPLSLPMQSGKETSGDAIPKSQYGSLFLGTPPDANAQRDAERALLDRYSPTGVLINEASQILQFRGVTTPYLDHPSGKANFDLLKMVRKGFMLPLRAAITKAKKEGKPVRTEPLSSGRGDDRHALQIEILPVRNSKEQLYWVLFEDEGDAMEAQKRRTRRSEPHSEETSPHSSDGNDEISRRNGELETEMAEMHDYLQSMREQYEAANEELQSANEELQSANEELQSINEEMETTKEELESANEELVTVNEEMSHRNTELRTSISDLNNLNASINTPILLLGRDLTIRRFTPMAEKIFNLLPGDVGRPIGNIRHTLNFPGLEKLLAQVIATAGSGEHDVQDLSGHWYSLRIRPYLSVDKAVDGAVLILIDIENMKQNEYVIRGQSDRLVQTTTQLETFVYSIAHDLRAPLRAITGYSEMLKEDYGSALDDKGIGFLDTITNSSKNLDHLLLDLLGYSRLLSANIELRPVSLEDAVSKALEQCREQIQSANAKIDLRPPLPVVRAHDRTLGQILVNLLTNAVKFVKPGAQPMIVIRAEEHPESVRLWIEDNGIGIEPEYAGKIFEVFQRGQNSRYPGTGVGLAIVQKGIDRMGGQVGVESIPGAGSRFWFDLPRPTGEKSS